MTDIQKKQITEMRTNGMIFASIASELSLSINSVKSFCRRKNIMPMIKSKCEMNSSPIPQNDRCKHCGKKLVNTPGQRQKTFCSRFCQQLYWREHPELMNHTAIILKRCPACGKEFSDYRGHSRKYCSHACYITDRYGKGESNEPERIDLPCDDEAVSENARKRADHSRGIRRN